jgi:hypothetical protein
MDGDSFLQILQHMDWNDIVKACKMDKNCAEICKQNRNTICKSQLVKIFNKGIDRGDKSYCDLFFEQLDTVKQSIYKKAPDKIELLRIKNKIFKNISLNDIHPTLLIFVFVYLGNCQIVTYLITEFSDCKKSSLGDISQNPNFDNIKVVLPNVNSISYSYNKIYPFYFAALNCDFEMMNLLYNNECTPFNPREYRTIIKSFNKKHQCHEEDANKTRIKMQELKDHMTMKGGVYRVKPRQPKIRHRPY